MKPVPLCPELVPALEHVCANMREWDRREIFATRWDDDPRALAADIMRAGTFGWLVGLHGEPIAAIGAMPMWPGVWSPWCLGTDKFKHSGLCLTRLTRRVILPTLFGRMNAHRLECRSMVGHTQAQQWLIRSFGARVEAELKGYGRQGEDFLLMVRERGPDDVHGR